MYKMILLAVLLAILPIITFGQVPEIPASQKDQKWTVATVKKDKVRISVDTNNLGRSGTLVAFYYQYEKHGLVFRYFANVDCAADSFLDIAGWIITPYGVEPLETSLEPFIVPEGTPDYELLSYACRHAKLVKLAVK